MDINYHQIKPSQALSDYVKFFWIGKVTASKEDRFRHLSIATRSPQLIFHYQGKFSEVTATGTLKESFVSGIQGPSKTHAEFISCENVGIFGIEFFPYAIPALFSISAAAVTNQYIDLKTFLGAKGSELEDKIFSATTNQSQQPVTDLRLPWILRIKAKTKMMNWKKYQRCLTKPLSATSTIIATIFTR